MNSKIYLITRFNVPLAHKQFSWNETWLHARIQLFRDYCLPSVESQTCPDFHWLIIIDEMSPDWFVSQLQLMTKNVAKVGILKMATFSVNKLKTYIENFEPETTKTVATTRLDTDDSISTDFMEDLKAYLTENTEFKGVISFANGYFTEKEKIYRIVYPLNSFNVCVGVLGEDWFTCHHYNHHKIGEFTAQFGLQAAVLQGSPKFLWTNHDYNISMRRGGSLVQHRTIPSVVRRNFDLAVLSGPDRRLTVFLENRYLACKRLYRAIRRWVRH
jgi:hypothetical protein